ncbi:MAG: AAA family ATPase [Patescibacteria group bacterium]|jgi:DNA polymerase-3 subunit delta'
MGWYNRIMEVKEVFSDLEGQATAKKWLLATLESGNLPQALIFAGPKGVGRRTAAKALAQYLHSQPLATSHQPPATQNHPDTFWYSQILDEVSKEKTREWIGAMRELTRRLMMSPMVSKYKVAIIDDAQNLNDAAQNALLKTLEEPRDDTVIILIVPNEEALLPTIVSRAQVVRFGPLTDAEIKKIVPQATDEQIAASGGSAGQVKDWEEMSIWWVDYKEMMTFWQKVQTADVETKFGWSEKLKDRDEAVEFIRAGMMVWREMLPNEKAVKGLERMQIAVKQIRDNVNLKGAIDTLLLAL